MSCLTPRPIPAIRQKEPKQVYIKIEMTEKQAMAFAEFLKRSALSTYRTHAKDDEEAYDMMMASEKCRTGFSVAGFSPR